MAVHLDEATAALGYAAEFIEAEEFHPLPMPVGEGHAPSIIPS